MQHSTITAHEISHEDWGLLAEAARNPRGDVSARVAGGGITSDDERRCWRLSGLECDGLLYQANMSGPIMIWRLTTEARALIG